MISHDSGSMLLTTGPRRVGGGVHFIFYGRPFVSKLSHDIHAFFCHVYVFSFLLCGVFIPKYMTFFLQTRIYMRRKKPIYALQYGATESRRIRDTEL